MTKSISILIPVYNEEESIKLLCHEIVGVLKKSNYNYEIVVIDDGSTDETLNRALEVKNSKKFQCKNNCRLRIIRLSRNFGQTAAMQAGFDNALGDYIITMDGDLQNDPNEIPKFIEKLEQGFDLVCGWRKNRKDKTLTRIFPSQVANWLIRIVTGVHIHDYGCSLKAYKKWLIQSVRLYSDMHRFIPAITSTVGANVTELIVNHRARKYGVTKYGLSRIWKVFFDLITIKMLINFYNQPIIWFASMGFIFLGCGLMMGVTAVLSFLSGGNTVVYTTASFMFLFLFASLLSWGLLSEFFIRIKKEIKGERKKRKDN